MIAVIDLCEIAKRGRSIEPEGAPHETSQVLQKSLMSLFNDGFGRARIARELNLPTAELEQLLFGLAMTGIEGGNQSTTPSSAAKLQRIK